MAAKPKSKAKPKVEKPKDDAPVVEGPKKPEIQVFKMIRNEDESGISGTGLIAHGVVWPDGHVEIQWLGPTPCETRWPDFEKFKRIHIESHPDNNTEIVWYDIRKRPAPKKEKD